VEAMLILFAVIMIIGQVGICLCNLKSGNWKEAALAILFSVANILIFLVKGK